MSDKASRPSAVSSDRVRGRPGISLQPSAVSRKSPTVRESLHASGKLSKLAPKRVAGVMNQTESKFALLFLDPLLGTREASSWQFEPVTFRLAHDVRYTPDFKLHLADGSVIYFEVKGAWDAPHQAKSRAKLRICAELHSDSRFASYEFKHHCLEWFGPHGSAPLSTFHHTREWDSSKCP